MNYSVILVILDFSFKATKIYGLSKTAKLFMEIFKNNGFRHLNLSITQT